MNPTTDPLQHLWHSLNRRYFHGALAPIRIEWSRRLTSSAGLFVSHAGPRSSRPTFGPPRERRLIRLSTPLLQPAGEPEEDMLLTTLAHEMIHQWQFDVLKRRPNHGPDFCCKMDELNREGLGITIRHRMHGAVRALAKYVWQCRRCGRAYERQRRTIHPGRHRCGACRGPLQESRGIPPRTAPEPCLRHAAAIRERLERLNRGVAIVSPIQLPLPLGGPS